MSTIFHGTSLGTAPPRGAASRPRTSGPASPRPRRRPSSRAARYLRNNMPAVYQDGDFGLRFLESLETTLDPIVGTLDVSRRLLPLDARPARRARAARLLGRATGRRELARRAAARGARAARARSRAGAAARRPGSSSRSRSRSRSCRSASRTAAASPGRPTRTRRRRRPRRLRGLLRHADPREDPARGQPGDRGDEARTRDLQAPREGSEEAAAAADGAA